MRKHAAILTITDKALLEILDLSGGTIHDIRRPREMFEPGTFELIIEHPDLPEVVSGGLLETMPLLHEVTAISAKVFTRVEPAKSKLLP